MEARLIVYKSMAPRRAQSSLLAISVPMLTLEIYLINAACSLLLYILFEGHFIRILSCVAARVFGVVTSSVFACATIVATYVWMLFIGMTTTVVDAEEALSDTFFGDLDAIDWDDFPASSSYSEVLRPDIPRYDAPPGDIIMAAIVREDIEIFPDVSRREDSNEADEALIMANPDVEYIDDRNGGVIFRPRRAARGYNAGAAARMPLATTYTELLEQEAMLPLIDEANLKQAVENMCNDQYARWRAVVQSARLFGNTEAEIDEITDAIQRRDGEDMFTMRSRMVHAMLR